MTTKIEPADATGEATEASVSNDSARPEATKALTVMLPEDLLKRLRVIAVLRDRSVSEVVADHVEALVKRELRKVLAKLEG